MNNLFQGYELKKRFNSENEPRLSDKKAPPHQLADHCQRLSDKLGIPFCTPILRFLKTDELLTESLVDQMAEKGIQNINYLTKAFYNQRKKYAK